MRKPWKAIRDGVLADERHRDYSGVVRSFLCPRIAVPWCPGICGVGYSAIDDIIPNRTNASNLPAFNGGTTHAGLGPRCARVLVIWEPQTTRCYGDSCTGQPESLYL